MNPKTKPETNRTNCSANKKQFKKKYSIVVESALVALIIIVMLIKFFCPRQSDIYNSTNGHYKTSCKPDTTSQPPISSLPTNAYQQEKSISSSDTQTFFQPGQQNTSLPKSKVRKKVFPDSLAAKPDMVLAESLDSNGILVFNKNKNIVTDPCQQDTILPWVYPEPSGGLHRGAQKVIFRANKSCTIEWKFDVDSEWQLYDGTAITVERSTSLWWRASDSCGKTMQPREEFYEISVPISTTVCPADMEHIKVGESQFCIDRYEWPNRKGVAPRNYVSVYQAMDSCALVGKRLCTRDEWTVACAGIYSWKYPYGQFYERRACVTHDTASRPSGSTPECRGYFDIYDMSGNLAEWTSTRSVENQLFFYVMGGFWESGPQSCCYDSRYSYFPQNRHNPIGFRCCKNIDTSRRE